MTDATNGDDWWATTGPRLVDAMIEPPLRVQEWTSPRERWGPPVYLSTPQGLEHGFDGDWLEPVDTTGILGRHGLAGLGFGLAAG